MNGFLGIDTSCYTTSIAILNDKGHLIADCRRLLAVKPGGRGLAQSEMVFQHTRNLPDLFQQAVAKLPASFRFLGIGVSSRPRPIAESYMPTFLVGHGYARTLGTALGIPVNALSHQENHIYSGLWSAKGPVSDNFLALHLSGGTTEVVEVRDLRTNPAITLLGSSQDLHAGQFIDRVGVALGLPFPAGPHVEQLAAGCTDKPAEIPSSVRNLTVSFSGPESQAQRLIAQGVDPAAIAAGVQVCIARTIVKLLEHTVEKTGLTYVLLAGGVTANLYIRQYVEQKLHKQSIQLYMPEPDFSTDNSVGAAFFSSQVAAKPVTA